MAAAAAAAAADVSPFIERQSISSMAVSVRTEETITTGHDTMIGRRKIFLRVKVSIGRVMIRPDATLRSSSSVVLQRPQNSGNCDHFQDVVVGFGSGFPSSSATGCVTTERTDALYIA